MNKNQKQVQQSLLVDEQQVAAELRGIYSSALADIDSKVQALLARQDANTPTVIYQVQHQLALKKQISGVLDQLQGSQFATVEKYLETCYTNGYIGAMYDISGQVGAPVVMAPDPRQVVQAVKLDSQISTDLYTALGENVAQLKKKISSTISRGISTGMSYGRIAQQLSAQSNTGFYNAMRIARTEGHRIQTASALDACKSAASMGCDVVKQWDSTLDGRTRPTHRQLDGQIREVDEDFEVTNAKGVTLKASAPGHFGRPGEDIHCRCALLQRAKWALDDDELEVLKERAKFYGLDKTKDFDDFKAKYIKALEAEGESVLPKPVYNKGDGRKVVELDDFPAHFRDTPTRKKQTQAFLDAINATEGADPDVLQLYKSMGSADGQFSKGVPIKVSYTADGHAVRSRYYTSTGKLADVEVKIPKIAGAGTAETTAHELGHYMDLDLGTSARDWRSARAPAVTKAFKNASPDMSDEVRDLFRRYNAECKTTQDAILARARKEVRAVQDTLSWSMPASEYKAIRRKADKLWKDAQLEADAACRAVMGGGVGELQDIYDALSGGMARDTGAVLYGHGTRYYSSVDKRVQETWANYCSLSVTHPDLIDMLRRDKPDLVDALHGLVVEINGGRKP